MKTIRLCVLALFLAPILNPASVFAQADRAKGLARRVAPGSRPAPAPYQQRAPATTPRAYPAQPAPQTAPPPVPPPAATAAPVLRTPAAPSDPAKAKSASDEAVRKTVEFQKKRAEEGSSVAQYDLGVRYLKGDGVEKDEAAGKKWIEKAAKDGNSQAVNKLKELEEATK